MAAHFINDLVSDEIMVLESMIGAENIKLLSEGKVVLTVGESVELAITIPEGYPLTQPPTILVLGQQKLQSELDEQVSNTWAGSEMLYDIYSWALDRLSSSGSSSTTVEEGTLAESSEKGTDNSVSETVDRSSHSLMGAINSEGSLTIARLDHIRDRKRYTKYLSKFSEQCGVICRLVVNEKAASQAASSSVKHHHHHVDFSNVLMIVRSFNTESDKLFFKLMRTEKVDLDSKSKPCLERNLSILSVYSDALESPTTTTNN
jgi:hypothetical protein